ncbi:MAG: acyl-CoA thioesterase [Chloroflexi bacterium]|jgi:acyl-CoA thioester hydrolase|nr:acyl-CoA thioesterase [Chloroflexota bacterium]
MTELTLDDFPLQTFDKIRYADTDRQGHVNNSVFSTFLETGRVEAMYNPEFPILAENSSFVIAALKLDFLREITWPGQVAIGTGILKIGASSIRFHQRLFQDGKCVASAEAVVVQIDNDSRRSSPLTDHAKEILSHWLLSNVDE